jgi:predicted DNA-binding protein
MSTSTVTKSIRLTPEESDELTRLAQQTASTEAALMKKWVLKGMEAQKLEFAIQAYMQRKTDLRGGAAMAGVPYNRFLREVQARNIVILENDRFLDRLAFLAKAFDSKTLRQAIERVEAETANTRPAGLETRV